MYELIEEYSPRASGHLFCANFWGGDVIPTALVWQAPFVNDIMDGFLGYLADLGIQHERFRPYTIGEGLTGSVVILKKKQ